MELMTPLDCIRSLIGLRNNGDREGARACYEADAAFVDSSGDTSRGDAAVYHSIDAAGQIPIKYGACSIIETGDLALHCTRWTVTMPDDVELTGCTADVLQRQSNGSWLVAIDNPWGTSIVPE